MPLSKLQRQRQQLIANVLRHAAAIGLPVTLAAMLDHSIRVRCPVTDHIVTLPIRHVTAAHVRVD
jgi:hypothetical protein